MALSVHRLLVKSLQMLLMPTKNQQIKMATKFVIQTVPNPLENVAAPMTLAKKAKTISQATTNVTLPIQERN